MTTSQVKTIKKEEEVTEILQLPLINSTELILGYDLYYGDYSEIQHITLISIWIQANFEYKYSNDWYSPEEITKNGFINLNGFATLLINIAKVRFNIEFDLVLIDTYDIMKYGTYNQAMVKYQGRIFNIFDLNSVILNREPNIIYLFNEVFQIFSLDFHTIL
jgi:hypothetical protein